MVPPSNLFDLFSCFYVAHKRIQANDRGKWTTKRGHYSIPRVGVVQEGREMMSEIRR